MPLNVQAIPRGEKTVKRAFVPKLDAFLWADYPNIELKMLAFYLAEIGHPSMAKVFREGADLHTTTAAGIFGQRPEDVTDQQRQTGKRLNFSIVFGGGVPTLLEQGIAKDGKGAIALLRRYHAQWPGIGWEMKNREAAPGTLVSLVKQRVRETETDTEPGYITTLWGRHLHPRAAHAMMNNLCQGSAADLMKWAMVRVHRLLTGEAPMRSHMVNTVHDELMLDCAREELEQLATLVPDAMTAPRIQAVVPIRPTPEVSFTTWADKQPMEAACIP